MYTCKLSKMKNLVYCFAILFTFVNSSFAQQSGRIDYKELGVAFTIPEGWVGQETNGVFLMGSHTKAGVIILAPQEYNSLENLQAEIRKGYQEAGGTSLTPASAINAIDQNTVVAELSGTLQWQAAKGFLSGSINPYGQDIVIMALTTSEMYSDEHRQLVLQVEKSLTFSQPQASNDWKSLLSGVKLTYMDSYYSGSYTDGGVSGGYSTEMVFDLCSAGYFIHYGSDNMTVGSDVSSGYSSSSSSGSGQWEVVGNTLRLKFNNGKVWEYQLSMQDKKLHLDGKRYYRTWTGDYAPNCR